MPQVVVIVVVAACAYGNLSYDTLCSTHVLCCCLLALHFYEQLNKLFVGRVAATKLLDNCHKARDLAASVNCVLHAFCQQLKQAHTQPFLTISNHPLSIVHTLPNCL